MTSHLLDSARDERSKLLEIIKAGTKKKFEEEIEYISSHTTDEIGERVRAAGKYILSNWTSAKLRLKRSINIVSCSAEGHVSHILSSRMSSRPMGWSKVGVDKMSHLRAYHENGGDMLELVRLQDKEMVRPEGTEEIITSSDMMNWENKHKNRNGKYFDAIQGSLGDSIKKKAWFESHLLGL